MNNTGWQTTVSKIYAWVTYQDRFRLLSWLTLLLIVIAFFVYALMLASYISIPEEPDYPREAIQQCKFHEITGLPCPLCGLSRSCASLAGLHFRRAIFYHPAGPGFSFAFLTAGVITLLRLVTWHTAFPFRLPCWILAGVFLALPPVFLINWVLRLMS